MAPAGLCRRWRLVEQRAGVVGEGLRVQGWAVGAAELVHPVGGCGRVGTVPPRAWTIEKIDVASWPMVALLAATAMPAAELLPLTWTECHLRGSR
jgi:hypothetical protein